MRSFASGGGVDQAIHRVATASPVGQPSPTAVGNLPAKRVIHAVGPRDRDGRHREAGLLAAAYPAAMAGANELGARSVTLSAITHGSLVRT